MCTLIISLSPMKTIHINWGTLFLCVTILTAAMFQDLADTSLEGLYDLLWLDNCMLSPILMAIKS